LPCLIPQIYRLAIGLIKGVKFRIIPGDAEEGQVLEMAVFSVISWFKVKPETRNTGILWVDNAYLLAKESHV